MFLKTFWKSVYSSWFTLKLCSESVALEGVPDVSVHRGLCTVYQHHVSGWSRTCIPRLVCNTSRIFEWVNKFGNINLSMKTFGRHFAKKVFVFLFGWRLLGHSKCHKTGEQLKGHYETKCNPIKFCSL